MWDIVGADCSTESSTESLKLLDFLEDLDFVSPLQVYQQNRCDIPRMEVCVNGTRVPGLRELDQSLRRTGLAMEQKFMVHQLCTQASLAYPCEVAIASFVSEGCHLGSGEFPHKVNVDLDDSTVHIQKTFRIFRLVEHGSETVRLLRAEVDVDLEAEACDITYTFLHDSFIPVLTICPPSEKEE